MVGFLSWVTPEAPNADLCASCKVVIQHVLDHTLNNGPVLSQQDEHQPHQQHQQQQEMNEPFLSSLGDSIGGFPDMEGLYFNFDLMDTFDWMRSDEVGTSM